MWLCHRLSLQGPGDIMLRTFCSIFAERLCAHTRVDMCPDCVVSSLVAQNTEPQNSYQDICAKSAGSICTQALCPRLSPFPHAEATIAPQQNSYAYSRFACHVSVEEPTPGTSSQGYSTGCGNCRRSDQKLVAVNNRQLSPEEIDLVGR